MINMIKEPAHDLYKVLSHTNNNLLDKRIV